MKKIKLYRKILLVEIGILATLTLHYFVTQQRGYKAVGGEFLLIPLCCIIYIFYSSITQRWKETNEYFARKENAVKYKDVYQEEAKWN